MAAPTTVDEFLDLLRKSSVLDEKRLLTQTERALAARPASPSDAAAFLVREAVLTNFQAEQLLLGKWKRFFIGKYKVLERLGSGGMGSVYLCEHRVMRRRVAVKVLPSAKANDPAARDRFEREAKAVAALDHRNVVHAYDVDQDESLHFLVMEYVDGASLQEIVKRSGPLDYVRAAHYVSQAAEGLGHAHDSGLIHRDIKPGNLMVDRTGVVKLLDMGLARFFNDEEDNLTKKYDENVLGTADYLAPEQATDSHSVDIRADIYSLGATFYFVLTGKTPFGDGTVAQKLLWHQTRQPRPIRTLRPDLPPGLANVIEKMMDKDPARRFQVPREVAAALHPWTRTPIPPPAESEMPKLSPAVAASPSQAEVNLGVSPASGSGSPSSATRKNWQIVGGPTASTSAAPEKTEVPKPATPPPRPRSKPELPFGQDQKSGKWMPFKTPSDESASAISEANPLEVAGPRTEDGSAHTDTPTQPPPKKVVKPVRAAPPRPRPPEPERTNWLFVIVMALLFAAAMGFGLFLFFPGDAGSGSSGRSIRRVSNNPAIHGAFPSILLALRDSKPGDKIVLMDPEHHEALVVDNAFGATAVTLEAAEGVKVRWMPPAGAKADEPILRLNSAPGFQLKGNGIQLDGQDKVKTLVTIAGNCPGLTLDNLEMRGFKRRAIQLLSCVGEARSPVRLQHLTTAATEGGETPEAAVVFEVDETTQPRRKNDHIVMEQFQWSGLPNRIAPIRRNPKVVGDNVRVP